MAQRIDFEVHLERIKEAFKFFPEEWNKNRTRLNETIITAFQDAIDTQNEPNLQELITLLTTYKSVQEIEENIKLPYSVENQSILGYAIARSNKEIRNILERYGFKKVDTPLSLRVPPAKKNYMSSGSCKRKSKKYRHNRKSRRR